MRSIDRIVRKTVVLVAALAALVTGGAVPASGAGTGSGTATDTSTGNGAGTSTSTTATGDGARSAAGDTGATPPSRTAVGGSATPGAPGTASGIASGTAQTMQAGAQDGRAAPGTDRNAQGDARASGARTFRGEAFDACSAPSLETMRAWRKSSPYGAVGVYIGGRARGCEQKNLTRSWVSAVHRMGWKLLPLYVGSQSPCVRAEHKRKYAMTTKNPWAQGAREGWNAVNRAKALGMTAGSPVYLDMEAYNQNDKSCAATTLRFIKAWNYTVNNRGYTTGFYSSADSGIAHMERARKAGETALPQALWFARWHVPGDIAGERRISSTAWQPHRRIHQYEGNVKKEYGGHTLNIDRNVMDAPVAVFG